MPRAVVMPSEKQADRDADEALRHAIRWGVPADRRFDHSAVLWLLLVFEGFLAGETGAPAEPSTQAALTG